LCTLHKKTVLVCAEERKYSATLDRCDGYMLYYYWYKKYQNLQKERYPKMKLRKVLCRTFVLLLILPVTLLPSIADSADTMGRVYRNI